MIPVADDLPKDDNRRELIIYATLYRQAQANLPMTASMTIEECRALLNTKKDVSPELASDVSALLEMGISEDVFNMHKKEFFRIFWHLYVCENNKPDS